MTEVQGRRPREDPERRTGRWLRDGLGRVATTPGKTKAAAATGSWGRTQARVPVSFGPGGTPISDARPPEAPRSRTPGPGTVREWTLLCWWHFVTATPIVSRYRQTQFETCRGQAARESAGHPSKDASVPSSPHPGESGEAERQNHRHRFRLVPGWRKPVGLRRSERPRPAPRDVQVGPRSEDRDLSPVSKRQTRDEQMDSSPHGLAKDFSRKAAPEVSSTSRATDVSLERGQRVRAGAEGRTRAARSRCPPRPAAPRAGWCPRRCGPVPRPRPRGLAALAGGPALEGGAAK